MASKKANAKEPVNGHIASNKRARHDFEIVQKFEAGIVLQGTEVKSLRNGQAQITDSYVTVDNNHEAWVENINIPHYKNGTYNNHEEKRKRKLLLNRIEIEKLKKQTEAKGMTIVALNLYFSKGRAKLEIGLAKGKHLYDKRESIKERDVKRSVEREYKFK